MAKRIVEVLFLDTNNPTSTIVHTPATTYCPVDDNREPAQGLCDYVSVVGMLNYLQGHSRINITFDVSQVARCVHSLKRSHELGPKKTGCYPKGTLDKVLILKPIPLE